MKGVLLVNLGSPDSTDPKDVKRYLDEFLMDPRVIDVPYWLRSFIVRGIILNTRPKKSAEAYSKIWWKEGSPLIVLSERLQDKVQSHTNLPIGLAMRYGSMTIKKGLQELVDKGVEEVVMYISLARGETVHLNDVTDKMSAILSKERYGLDVKLACDPNENILTLHLRHTKNAAKDLYLRVMEDGSLREESQR